jgi:hypothetical protein
MKTNSTFNTLRLLKVLKVLVMIFLIMPGVSFSQKWSGVNGNEWLAGKYSQPWVRIGVATKGIHKVNVSDLPQAFKDADKNRLELWHRGVQVSIIKADASEILFYGVPNDGASDQLLYRLETSRKNPYYSTYSDESAYFLTINPTTNGNRAITPVVSPNPGAVTLQSHIKTDIKKYANEYSHSTANFYRPATFNSYFEEGKQGTGTALLGEILGANIQTSNPKSVLYTNSYVPVPFSFQIKVPFGAQPKKVTVHIKARLGASTAEIYVGKTAGTLRSVGTLNVTDLNDYDYTFDLQNDDFDPVTGAATLGFKSTKTGSDGSGYSVSYFIVEYDQAIDMQSLNSYEFVFPATTSGSQSKIAISNPAASAKVYDVSNADVPKIISGPLNDLAIDRDDKKLTLLVTNETTTVAPAKIGSVTFQDINPADFDYLIVCANSLNSSATTFGEYRKTLSPGAKYKPLVKNITDIYNQFNYGEPSPVAIRRYVDFMISDNNKNKFLLLLGRSVTYFERSVREIPDEVPTIGFPGSDMLLVDGLGGEMDDVPAIPVGRVSASTNQQVLDYLAKVTVYENDTDLAWRKNVMHMSGGKSTSEVNQFAGYMAGIAGSVTNAPYSGSVLPRPKTNPALLIEQMTFSTELNGNGLGMVSYFGHGSVDQTDYNAGYVSDPGKGYNNPTRYPVLFYNGCGVNNIFSGRTGLFGSSPNNLVRPMSLDWLLTPGKGAIIVFGNTWDAFASNSNEYLDRLYPLIFQVSDSQRKTIGQILQEVARQTKIAKGYTYNAGQNSRVAAFYNVDRANVHQILLQGDPALRILITEGALPVKLISFDAKAEANRVKLDWKTASETNNSHFEIERSYNGKIFESIGRVEGKGTTETETSYTFFDSKPLVGTSYYRLKQVDSDRITNNQVFKGASNYSKIVSVDRESDKFLVVSPNPSADYAEIALDAPVKVKGWNLIDVKGKVVKQNQKGVRVNLSGLPTGEYIVEILTENGDVYHKKIVKK